MSYSPGVKALLDKIGAEEGDLLTIKSEGREYSGVLMPHHEFSHPDIIVIKLKSGYNIGVKVGESTHIAVHKKSARKEREARPLARCEGKKEIAVLGTGGTIASYVDYRTGAVHPALSANELVATVPEIADICNVRADVLFSIYSENMKVEYWQKLAGAVADMINDGVEGCLIPHGTDTMGYTAAALSFMLEDLPRPVVLVGAQRSSDRPSSDAYVNLVSAARFVIEGDAAETYVMMHETPSDTVVAVHRGVKVRKMHTSRRDAFHSINSLPVARVDFEGGITYLSEYRRKHSGKVKLKSEMDPNVALLYFYPGMSPSAFENTILSHGGVVIAGSGLGHVSADMIKVVKKAIDQGISVVMTSQCLNGRVNLNVYDTGRDMLTAGVIPGEDMLPETAFVKLMWVLGRASSPEEIRMLMTSDLRGEITTRRELDE